MAKFGAGGGSSGEEEELEERGGSELGQLRLSHKPPPPLGRSPAAIGGGLERGFGRWRGSSPKFPGERREGGFLVCCSFF